MPHHALYCPLYLQQGQQPGIVGVASAAAHSASNAASAVASDISHRMEPYLYVCKSGHAQMYWKNHALKSVLSSASIPKTLFHFFEWSMCTYIMFHHNIYATHFVSFSFHTPNTYSNMHIHIYGFSLLLYRPTCAKYFIPISRVINMGLSVLMAFAAVNGIMKIVEFRLDTFFVALYML